MVGNFLDTLKECDCLLQDNKRYRAQGTGQRSNPVLNLRYNLTQQEQRVDDLRRRLQFHAEKIRFVVDRLQLALLTDADARAEDLLGLAEQNLVHSKEILFELQRFRQELYGYFAGQGSLRSLSVSDVHFASADVAAKLQEYLQINAPLGLPEELLLAQSFDALLLHFQHSINGDDQTPEKYLSFLKVRWFIKRLKDSRGYRNARPGFYFKRAINQIEAATVSRARRSVDIITYGDDVLLGLSSACFHIWPEPMASHNQRRKEPDEDICRPNEIETLRAELAFDEEQADYSVIIFKSSDTVFRVVRVIKKPGERLLISQRIDTAQDRLIPRYALPTLTTSGAEIATFARNEETLFTFKSFADLYRFQTAFTGYQIPHDHGKANIRCQFSDEAGSLDCEARIQLWQDPIAVPRENTDEIIDASTGSSGSASGRADSQLSLGSTNPPTLNVTIRPEGWEAGRPKLAALVIFTQLSVKKKAKLAIIFLELVAGVYVRLEECKCHEAYDKCPNLVLTRGKKRKLDIRVQYSESDDNGQPDPNTYDILTCRLPKSQAYRNLPQKFTEYLVLSFKTLPEKRRFHEEINARIRIRDKQIKDVQNFEKAVQHQQNRARRSEFTNNEDSSASTSRTSPTAPSPPQISLLDSGPSFLSGISTMLGRRASGQSSRTSMSTNLGTNDTART